MGKGPFGTLQSGVIPIPILGGVGLVPDDTALRTVVRHLVLSDLSDAIRLVKLGIHAIIALVGIVLFDGEGVVDLRAVRQVVTRRSLGFDKPVRAEWQIRELERILGRIDVLIGVILRGGALVVLDAVGDCNGIAIGIRDVLSVAVASDGLQFPFTARQYPHPVRGIDLAPADPTVRRIGDRVIAQRRSIGLRNGRVMILLDGERIGLFELHVPVRSPILLQIICSIAQTFDQELTIFGILVDSGIVSNHSHILSLEFGIVAVGNGIRNLAPHAFLRSG